MSRLPLLLFLAVSLPQTCLAAVTFDWAYVANAGNAPDPPTGNGSVSYNYAISKHEVTNAQYAEFLNAVDPTGANGLDLYNTAVSSFGSIRVHAGDADGSKYVAQTGHEQKPVTHVSFFDAMRFTNWLHNGQGNSDTETGAYTIGNGVSEVRSPDAKYWIPNEGEWYKAAYHDASAGTAGAYFDYATGSDALPVSDQPSDNPAAVNYYNDDGIANGFNDGYAVSGSTRDVANPFTDVGAYTVAASPYGTFDQNGNVWEWTESVVGTSLRGLRGGFWAGSANNMRAGFRGSTSPMNETFFYGIRVATIPEPTSLALAAMLAGCGMMRRRIA
jgi:sulfatase modifying factor 1